MGTGKAIPMEIQDPAKDEGAWAALESRAAEADAVDQVGKVDPPADPEPVGADPIEVVAGALSIASIVADQLGYKRTAAVWSPDACKGVAARIVPVLVKYTWGRRVMDMLQSGAGVEELALVVYLAPMALATAAAWRADSAPANPDASGEVVADAHAA